MYISFTRSVETQEKDKIPKFALRCHRECRGEKNVDIEETLSFLSVKSSPDSSILFHPHLHSVNAISSEAAEKGMFAHKSQPE